MGREVKFFLFKKENDFVGRKNDFVEQKNQGRRAELSENSNFPEYIPIWQYMVKANCQTIHKIRTLKKALTSV